MCSVPFLKTHELLLQILDKYLHSLKDDLKKKDDELTKEKTERKSVEKVLEDSLANIKKVRFSPASLVCLLLLTSCGNFRNIVLQSTQFENRHPIPYSSYVPYLFLRRKLKWMKSLLSSRGIRRHWLTSLKNWTN